MAKLGCSFRDAINSQHIKALDNNFKEFVSVNNFFMVQGFMASWNEYYPMVEKWLSQQLMCSGFDYREPFYSFDGNRLLFRYEIIDEEPVVGDYCESEYFMSKLDYRVIFAQDEVENHKHA